MYVGGLYIQYSLHKWAKPKLGWPTVGPVQEYSGDAGGRYLYTVYSNGSQGHARAFHTHTGHFATLVST